MGDAHSLGFATEVRAAARNVYFIAIVVLLSIPAEAGAVCTCLNNASVYDLDANTGGADGQFSETVTVNAPSGQTWTVSAATGAFDAFNVPPVGVQSAMVPIPTNGTVALTASGTTYTIDFVFVESLGYTLSVTNGRGTTLSIGNNCLYPNPVFSPAIRSVYQSTDAAVTLGAQPASGPALASTVFTIDGLPQTQLIPAALAPWPSIHTAELTATGTLSGQYRACVQRARKSFSVVTSVAVPTIDPTWGGLLLSALMVIGLLVRRRR
jgi:hypothetical protein